MDKKKFRRALAQMALLTAAMIILPAALSFTAEYPGSVTDHYLDKSNIYWKIRQIAVSPIFDEPETSQVELYIEKSGRLYLSTDDKKIFAIEDTIWTYLVKHKQIQKAIGGQVFNPFDLIDTSQTFYSVLESTDDFMILNGEDPTLEPDSLRLEFNKDGMITSINYLDVNKNEVIMQFLEESFTAKIPRDNFLFSRPKGVEIIDISD